MELQYIVKTLDEAPEQYRDLYAEQSDGTYRLRAIGAASKSQLDDFRASNIERTRRIEDLEAKFQGIDPAEYRRLQHVEEEAKKTKVLSDEEKLLQEGKMEELQKSFHDRHVKPLQETHAKSIQEKDTEITRLRAALHSITVTAALQKVAAELNIADWARPDFVLIGEQCFRLNDAGEPVAYEIVNGEERQRYNKNGDPLTMKEFGEEEMAKRPPWRPPSSGGGATHQSRGGQNGMPDYSGMSPTERITASRQASAKTGA